MLNNTYPQYISIRFIILFLHLVAPLSTVYTLLLLRRSFFANLFTGPIFTTLLQKWCLAETLFFVTFLWYRGYLQHDAIHPPLRSKEERKALFEKVRSEIHDPARFLKGWFRGAEVESIGREDLKEFMSWAFWEGRDEASDEEELEELTAHVEKMVGKGKFKEGRGTAKSLRLTLDPIDMQWRSLVWYAVIVLVDTVVHIRLLIYGFSYTATKASSLRIFPPRPLAAVAVGKKSPVEDLSYWRKAHTSKTRMPVVFIHGIGVGLHPYVEWFHELDRSLNAGRPKDNQVGILAIEILQISTRLTEKPVLSRSDFLTQITKILDHEHGYQRFVLVSHSYGSVFSTHMLTDDTMSKRVAGTLLVDPVTMLLHMPDVAYNFTMRKPTTASEWQLWYFASKDPTVAYTLGRHFFWSENILWRDHIADLSERGNRITVSLAGRDLIVDTEAVGAYLMEKKVPDPVVVKTKGGKKKMELEVEGKEKKDVEWKKKAWKGEGVEVLWWDDLDHAQVFDDKRNRGKLVEVTRCFYDNIGHLDFAMALISAPSVNSRFAQLCIASILLLGFFWYIVPPLEAVKELRIPGLHSSQPKTALPSTPPTSSDTKPLPPKPHHPIDHLVARAEEEYAALLAQETTTVEDAARAYRERRGRHPPPHFDLWFTFARNQSALMIEPFFDQIYTDLAPFWGVPAKQTREQANAFVHRISVRNGNVTQRTDIDERVWMGLWQEMVQSIAEWLPDLDMPINVMDESRVVVPWEEVDGYMSKEQASRGLVDEKLLVDTYGSRGVLRELDLAKLGEYKPEFQGMGPYWPLAVVGCPPDSAARKAYIETDFTTPPKLTGGHPEGSYHGYVKNWTLATSPCDNAHLQGIHGTFVEPISIATSKTFFPLFGGSKLPMNNEILLPPAMYWTEDPFYSGGSSHGSTWEMKKPGLIWRGAASGGRNKEENWRRFQRHRFVSMVNSTSVREAETTGAGPPNFVLPAYNPYDLASTPSDNMGGTFADWVGTWSDAAVVHLLCFPDPNPPYCSYTDPYFKVAKSIPMAEQYSYKYLPDIDGNSFSGRYRAFLFSTSVPIKATIYREWHDSRLVPWKHFVPMHNEFSDVYGIMEYFFGNAKEGLGGHDAVGRGIAEGGKAWAEKVLRKEDMMVYVLRLLLEYARVCDDDRDVMGWRGGQGVG
ncbi:hypothetical protein LTR62_006454 [Meristemomyces frigidus]|uniref:Glycosyl transferase CAP10 domain-containing protein n=1 Tax=Meristemomyces frigidus TaxID=1508187 RepID=A0AAN7TBZ4_9PEZI|nr:hypothetical protein LTR62_006454 [Meristemomyces frigidus]